MKSQMIFMFIFFALILLNCEKNLTPVVQNAAAVYLQVEEVMVTEAWLKLSVQNLQAGQQAVVWRDSLEIFRSNHVSDTVIYDNGLQPARSYNYHAAIFNNQQPTVNSQPLPLTTMDTTSHNFTWTIDTIGTHSSTLFDVAIINENDIWAVGEIHTLETDKFDSLGNWVPPYNAVHWDGNEWQLIRTEAEGYGYGENYTVFAFSPNDVWIGSTIPEHWDGQKWTFYGSPTNYPGGFRIRKIWGTSSNNLYFVGEGGNIVRYNGQSWLRLNTDTDINFYDIWGAVDPKSGKTEIMAVGTSWPNPNPENILVSIEGFRAIQQNNTGLPQAITNLWFMPGRMYYVVGNGVYYNRKFGDEWQHDANHPLIFKSAIRGKDINDIIVTGAFGLVSHFNGKSWKHYSDNEFPTFQGSYGAADYKYNIIVAVGYIGSKAIILKGVRNE